MVPANATLGVQASEVYHYHTTTGPPYTFGCFGPVDSLAACKALYTGESAQGGCLDGVSELSVADSQDGSSSTESVDTVRSPSRGAAVKTHAAPSHWMVMSMQCPKPCVQPRGQCSSTHIPCTGTSVILRVPLNLSMDIRGDWLLCQLLPHSMH
jgi:hypothetical protein